MKKIFITIVLCLVDAAFAYGISKVLLFDFWQALLLCVVWHSNVIHTNLSR